MNSPVFSRKYMILNEVLNAITHGIGVGLSIAGLVFLLTKGVRLGSLDHIVSYAIYGTTMILLFLSSTLFHSLIFTKAKKIFQIFDHSSIFLLIAGSYTPFCLLAIKGWLGWGLLVAIWLLAILGVVYKSVWITQASNGATIIYIIMGWLCVLAAYPLFKGLGLTGMMLLAGGGVAYTLGAFFYSMRSIRFMHVVWHLFVMLGAGLMYFSVLLYT